MLQLVTGCGAHTAQLPGTHQGAPAQGFCSLAVTELEVSRTAPDYLLRLFQLKVLKRHKTQGPQGVSLTLLNSAPGTKLLPSS